MMVRWQREAHEAIIRKRISFLGRTHSEFLKVSDERKHSAEGIESY